MPKNIPQSGSMSYARFQVCILVHREILGCMSILSKPVNPYAPLPRTTGRNINEFANSPEEGDVHLETTTLTTQLKFFLVMNLASQRVLMFLTLKTMMLRLLRLRSAMMVMNVWTFFHMMRHKAGFVFPGLHVYLWFMYL